MDSNPRILIWNYTDDEQMKLNLILDKTGAPSSRRIAPDQGHLYVHELLFDDKHSDDELISDERVVLFFNVFEETVRGVMQGMREEGLPRPIFAMVTEHSINWKFSYLLEHLIEERQHVMKIESQQGGGAV